MKPDEEVIGNAIRIEYDNLSNRLFVVFEIVNENYKSIIQKDWKKDIEFKILNKQLVKTNG